MSQIVTNSYRYAVAECTEGTTKTTTEWGNIVKGSNFSTVAGLACTEGHCYTHIRVHYKSGNSGSAEVGFYDDSLDLIEKVSYAVSDYSFAYSDAMEAVMANACGSGGRINPAWYCSGSDSMYYTGYNDNQSEFCGTRLKSTSHSGLPSTMSGSNEADPVQFGVKYVGV